MTPAQFQSLLTEVADGTLAIDEALTKIRHLPFEQTDFATLDHHRAIRCGHPEVILCQNKTTAQILDIAKRLLDNSSHILATRASAEHLAALKKTFTKITINEIARAAIIGEIPEPSDPPVAVVCAGTADAPVLEESVMTLYSMAVNIHRICDVGVSGLHRLLPHVPALQKCCAIVVIAGMDGALPSVVGGLVASPVFAVPTSIGYGTSFKGLAALLTMLNSCAANVSVVNIDNGFGAAYSAALVQKQMR